jgi:hypothetical protein
MHIDLCLFAHLLMQMDCPQKGRKRMSLFPNTKQGCTHELNSNPPPSPYSKLFQILFTTLMFL